MYLRYLFFGLIHSVVCILWAINSRKINITLLGLYFGNNYFKKTTWTSVIFLLETEDIRKVFHQLRSFKKTIKSVLHKTIVGFVTIPTLSFANCCAKIANQESRNVLPDVKQSLNRSVDIILFGYLLSTVRFALCPSLRSSHRSYTVTSFIQQTIYTITSLSWPYYSLATVNVLYSSSFIKPLLYMTYISFYQH